MQIKTKFTIHPHTIMNSNLYLHSMIKNQFMCISDQLYSRLSEVLPKIIDHNMRVEDAPHGLDCSITIELDEVDAIPFIQRHKDD